jgi:hypothetical protein
MLYNRGETYYNMRINHHDQQVHGSWSWPHCERLSKDSLETGRTYGPFLDS